MNAGGAGLASCALAAAVAPTLGAAADWSVQSAAQLYAQAETNPQLLAGEKRGAQAGVADASLDLLRRTELLDLNLTGHASVYRYRGDSGLDRDDQQVALAMSRRGETWAVRGNASLTRDTTLTSELGTTGITEFNQRHRARGLSLAPSWQLAERISTGLTLGWQDSQYARAAHSGLSNYDYSFAGFNTGYDLSERTSVSLAINAGRLDSELYTFNTDNFDVRLQVEHALSLRWRMSIAGGPSKVKTDGRSTGGSVFNASLSRQGENFNLGLSMGRSNSPNGSGLLSRRDEIGLSAQLDLSEHVSAGAGLGFVRSKDLIPGFGFTVNDVRYTRVDASLSWGFARDWSLSVRAGSAEQELRASGARGRNLDARLVLAWRRYNPVG